MKHIGFVRIRCSELIRECRLSIAAAMAMTPVEAMKLVEADGMALVKLLPFASQLPWREIVLAAVRKNGRALKSSGMICGHFSRTGTKQDRPCLHSLLLYLCPVPGEISSGGRQT